MFLKCRDLDSKLATPIVARLWAELSRLPADLQNPDVHRENLGPELVSFIDGISSVMLYHPNPTRQFQRNYSRCTANKPWTGQEPPKKDQKAPDVYKGVSVYNTTLDQQSVDRSIRLLTVTRIGVILAEFSRVNHNARWGSDYIGGMNLVSQVFCTTYAGFHMVKSDTYLPASRCGDTIQRRR